MDGLMRVARQHKVFVIEDACQADAVSYKGRRLGAIGDVGCFSFNYYKIITCGEGGAITTDSDEVYDRALVMHDSGITFRPRAEAISIPTFVGLNFRLNNILAAMLRAQLTQVDGWLTRMRAIKARMLEELSARGVPLLPSNDLSGDSGMTIGIQFPTEAETLQCMQAMKRRASATCGPSIPAGTCTATGIRFSSTGCITVTH
jgi:dTDP-4-amino-4,6-dideoxygalactose transaminase